MSNNRPSIVVALDFSAPSMRALDWALDYAKRTECDVHVLHVVERHVRFLDLDPGGLDAMRTEVKDVIAAATAELEKIAPTEAEREAIGTLHRHVVSGHASKLIVKKAAELDADLLVIGTHGHTGIDRVLLGSVAASVVRHSPCTVVTVKEKAAKQS